MTTIFSDIRPTPQALVEDGRIHTGFFATPFRQVDLLGAHNLGGPLAKPLRWLRLKEWVGFGVNHPQLFGGILIQNAKYAGSGTVYLFERNTGRLYDWLIADPLASLPENLWKGVSRCGRGKRGLSFDHDLEHNQHRITARHNGNRALPPVTVELKLHQNLETVDPLVVSLPIAPDHHTYTHKSPLRLEGRIVIGDTVYDFDPERDLGNLDEQKTFYPYRSRWLWGSFAAFSTEGREIMVNFVDQMTPADEPGEDAMWVDGRLMLLPQPAFLPQGDGSYRLEDREGRIRLRFAPRGAKTEKRNFGLLAIDYAQHFGAYEGEVVDAHGQTHRIDNAFGALEKMHARF